MVYFNNYTFDDKYKLGMELLDFYLPYRDSFNFSSDITFGFEIEFFNGKYSQLRDELYENSIDDWKVIFEPTISYFDGFNNIIGGEVISPVLTFCDDDFDKLKKVCDLIKFCFGEVNDLTAGHIHVGSQVFEDKDTMNKFLLIWSIFEDVIKRFFSGEFINIKENDKYAALCSSLFINNNFNIDNLLSLGKSYAVSFYYFDSFDKKYMNTIEFRDIKGSLEEEVWQNNINFLIHLINWCKSLNDKDILKIKNSFFYNNFSYDYEIINFDKALFLADNIFSKELDKYSFLKQYFKDFYLDDGTFEKVRLIREK